MNFKIKKKIGDILIIEYKKFLDSRGYFSETFKSSSFREIIPNFKIKQINESLSSNNVLRGLHLQVKPPMSKAMRVIKGKAELYAYDLRFKCKQKVKIHKLTLTDKDNLIIWAPHYYARGFKTLMSNTKIQYFCDNEYNSNGEYAISILEKKFKIFYDKKSKISSKDISAMELKEWYLKKII